jgi:hypothetical protein
VDLGLGGHPTGNEEQSAGKQIDVEHIGPFEFLISS